MGSHDRDSLTREFMEKHGFNQADMNNLARYERVRKSREMNMMEYIVPMKRYNANGGIKLADWIMSNYGEYLDYLEKIN